MVVGASVVVTSPNQVATLSPLLSQFEDVVVTANSLTFVLDLRVVSGGYQLLFRTLYVLAKM